MKPTADTTLRIACLFIGATQGTAWGSESWETAMEVYDRIEASHSCPPVHDLDGLDRYLQGLCDESIYDADPTNSGLRTRLETKIDLFKSLWENVVNYCISLRSPEEQREAMQAILKSELYGRILSPYWRKWTIRRIEVMWILDQMAREGKTAPEQFSALEKRQPENVVRIWLKWVGELSKDEWFHSKKWLGQLRPDEWAALLKDFQKHLSQEGNHINSLWDILDASVRAWIKNRGPKESEELRNENAKFSYILNLIKSPNHEVDGPPSFGPTRPDNDIREMGGLEPIFRHFTSFEKFLIQS